MHPRIQELVTYLDAQRAALHAAVEAVPAAHREHSPAPGRWSVAQVLEHLSIVERRVAQLLAAKVADAKAQGVGAETESSSVVATLDSATFLDRNRRLEAPERLQPRQGVSTQDGWAALEASRTQFLAAVRSCDGLALGTMTQHHPVLGTLNLCQWIAAVGGHEARHTAQVQEIGAAAIPVGSSSQSQS